MFRRDVTVGVSNQDRRIVRSIREDYDEQFDDLEALRLAALQSLHSRNCHAKASSFIAESGDTRHVSLGEEEHSDLKIITVERCHSFSSSSTDYEEIDLSTFSNNEENQDKEMFSDPENDESCSDVKDDVGSISSACYREEDEYEEVSSCSENVTAKEYLSDVQDQEDFDCDEGGIDVAAEQQSRAQCISEISDDELLESDNEFSILNDISITIPNETLVSREEKQPNDVCEENQLNPDVDTHEFERNDEELWESLHKKPMVSSQSDDEQDNESALENDIELSKNAKEDKTKSPVLGKIEKRDLITGTLSVSQTPEKEKVKTGFSGHPESNRQEAKQSAGKKDRPLQMALKTNAKTLAEHNSNLGSSRKGKTQSKQGSAVTLKAQQHEKLSNEKGKLTGSSDSILRKAVNQEGHVKAKTGNPPAEALVKSEHRETDFDQLSIEDEDSEFEEGGKEEPAVKSKVGLNRTAGESLLAKRSHSMERRHRRYPLSPTSRDSRLYHRHPGSYDRPSDYRFRSWSRERHRNRSPTWRGIDSHYLRFRRSRSRDRKQTHVNGRDREIGYRRSRSRSRSRDHRTRNDTYSHFRRKEKRKDNLQEMSSKAKESRNITKESSSDTSLTRLRSKELKSEISIDSKKTANVKHELIKPSSEISLGKVSKVKVFSFAARNADVENNQTKDLRTRLEETTQKAVTREKTAAKKDQEKELDARIKKIKQRNDAILRRAKEIQADKMKYSCF